MEFTVDPLITLLVFIAALDGRDSRDVFAPVDPAGIFEKMQLAELSIASRLFAACSETARKLGSDESEEAFERSFRKIVPPKNRGRDPPE